jgi:hypothetical protein
MKMTRRVFGAVLALIMMLSLAGCGGMTTDDAKAYVQSVLDASYKADFSEYTEQTDSTEEEAQQLFDDNLDNIMSMGGFTDAGLSDELSANYRQLFQDMLAQAKYELGEATEGEDGGFVVEVRSRLQLLTDFRTKCSVLCRRRWPISQIFPRCPATRRSMRWFSRKCMTALCRE